MVTEDELVDLVESNREPTRAELAALMRRYLVGAVDDATVERLHEQFKALHGDEGRWRAESSAFRANGRRYRGQAWKELLSPHENRPSLAELALWLAIVTPGYPAPRPYCPPELAGTWQGAASGATWKLASDGSFSTTDARFARDRLVRWCVHLLERRGDFHRDRLWLLDADRHNTSPQQLIILESKPDRLSLLFAGGDAGDTEYAFTRIAA
jgi:hypothetical protein